MAFHIVQVYLTERKLYWLLKGVIIALLSNTSLAAYVLQADVKLRLEVRSTLENSSTQLHYTLKRAKLGILCKWWTSIKIHSISAWEMCWLVYCLMIATGWAMRIPAINGVVRACVRACVCTRLHVESYCPQSQTGVGHLLVVTLTPLLLQLCCTPLLDHGTCTSSLSEVRLCHRTA